MAPHRPFCPFCGEPPDIILDAKDDRITGHRCRCEIRCPKCENVAQHSYAATIEDATKQADVLWGCRAGRRDSYQYMNGSITWDLQEGGVTICFFRGEGDKRQLHTEVVSHSDLFDVLAVAVDASLNAQKRLVERS